MKALFTSFIMVMALFCSGSVMAQDKKKENKQLENTQKKEVTDPKNKENAEVKTCCSEETTGKEAKGAQASERKTAVPQNLKSCGKK